MAVHGIPLEVWMRIGQQVTQKRQRTLRGLSETCRCFHKIFTPLLFSLLRFTGFEEIVSPNFIDFTGIPHLRHVRTLRVIVGSGYAETRSPDVEAFLYETFNQNLISCLESMPNLVSFTLGLPGPWRTLEEEDDGVNSVPLFNDLLHALQLHTPKLNGLTLCVPSIPSSDDENNEWIQFISRHNVQRLVEFRNLTSLVLTGEFALPTGIQPLISTLLDSPRLTNLSLDIPGAPLSSICTEYAGSDRWPLALKRLRFSITNRRLRSDWPVLGQLTDLNKLECLELGAGDPFGDHDMHTIASRELIYTSLADPSRFGSLRRLSVDRLDDSILAAIRTVGQDLAAPPFLLSELFFKLFDWDTLQDGFNIDPQKREYWPTCFALGHNTGNRAKREVRQGLVDEISEWRGLRLLHLSLDMERDQSHIVSLADSLTNLRELYITDNHSPPTKTSSVLDDSEYGSELAFGERLCVRSRISYLVVWETGYRVIRSLEGGIRLEIIQIASSETEEAEIFMLYREPTGM